MNIHVTSRHFKAHSSLNEYAEHAVHELLQYYDGIISADVILSYEKPRNSLKVAEISVKVYNAVLIGMAKNADFFKSIDGAVEKVLVQLKKYKDKLHAKDRKQVRRVREKV
ncbi:MAG: ribosome-associated translation inhibitor RaiA [Bacteroidota bacterium]